MGDKYYERSRESGQQYSRNKHKHPPLPAGCSGSGYPGNSSSGQQPPVPPHAQRVSPSSEESLPRASFSRPPLPTAPPPSLRNISQSSSISARLRPPPPSVPPPSVPPPSVPPPSIPPPSVPPLSRPPPPRLPPPSRPPPPTAPPPSVPSAQRTKSEAPKSSILEKPISMNLGKSAMKRKMTNLLQDCKKKKEMSGASQSNKLMMNIQSSAKIGQKSAPLANVFNEDSDSEEEEMPAEARMRMKNIGRETPTASGPNSFGKGKGGFSDRNSVLRREMEEQELN